MKLITIQPIKETLGDYEAIERAIKLLFRKELYLPLLRELGEKGITIRNQLPGLLEAIRTGKITYSRGTFSGKLNSTISKQLRDLGATYDRREAVYRLPASRLPQEVKHAISSSAFRFQDTIQKIDKKLKDISPEELAGKVDLSSHFDQALWKVDSQFQKSVKGLTVPAQLTPHTRKRIAAEWSENLKLYIKDFTEKEILELRKKMQKTVFAGDRYGSAIATIQKSYGVSANKAKFLARQETSLLMTKFKQTRYEDAGVKEYKWGCVSGSKNHPVRPWHRALQGKIFRWDNPPVTTKPGEPQRRNNPGQDYNCRCFARPIIRR